MMLETSGLLDLGKQKRDGGSPAGFALDLNRSAMQIHDAFDDR
jgi:hypothetical protein